MTTEIVRLEGQIIVKPGRDIVASMVQELKAELRSIAAENPGRLIIDLTGVEMMDSLGIGVLIAAHNTLSKRGGRLTLIHVSQEVGDLLKAMRLDRHFDVQG